MQGEDAGDGREGRVEPQSAAGWGCTVTAVAGLLGIILALRWSAAVGIPLFVIAAVLGWRSAKRAAAISGARTDRRRTAHGALVGDVWRRLFAAEGLGEIVDRWRLTSAPPPAYRPPGGRVALGAAHRRGSDLAQEWCGPVTTPPSDSWRSSTSEGGAG